MPTFTEIPTCTEVPRLQRWLDENAGAKCNCWLVMIVKYLLSVLTFEIPTDINLLL